MTDNVPTATVSANSGNTMITATAGNNQNAGGVGGGERRESHSFGNVPQYKSSNAGNGEKPYQVEEEYTDKSSGSGNSNVAIIGTFDDGVGYFGRRVLRILLITCAILWYALLAMAFWFDTDDLEDKDKAYDTSYVDGYNCKGIGLLFILFACLACLLIQGIKCTNNTKTEYWIVNIVILAVLVFGGFLYLVGSFVIASSIGKANKDSESKDWRTTQTWQVSDGFFIFLLTTTFGLDIWRNYLGLSVRLRSVVVLNIIYLFSSLLNFFGFAGLSDDTATSRTRTVAAGFFFVLIGGIMLLILEFLDVCCQCAGAIRLYVIKARVRIMLVVSVTFYLFGTFLVDCGLWAIADNADYGGKANAAIVGMSFLFSFVAVFISIDVVLGEYISAIRGKNKENQQQNQSQNSQALLP